MYKNKKILCIIPARGGSKGLPGKNIRPLLGKPLIGWTVDQAKKSSFLDRIFISTDDEGIASVCRQAGVQVPELRPAELAADNSKVIDTLLYTFDKLEKEGEKFDYLALLEPTSPIRKKDDIDRSIKKLIDNEDRADSLISIGEIQLEHPVYSKKLDDEGYVRSYVEIPQDATAMRQGLAKSYFPYGVIYLTKVETIRKHKAAYAGRIIPLVIERWQNYEINDIYDFLSIESVMRYQLEKNPELF